MSNFFLSCKESKIENPRSFYGSFYIGPFNESQSLTVANALRRTLLSELSGIAITSVEIEGVNHEYSTLRGVRDSVLDILLNLKEIVLKSNTFFQNTQIGYLNARGPGVVRACDLKLPACIQCVDPNQYIATLSEDGFLNMKFKINKGKNYIIQNQKNIVLDTKYPDANRVKISQSNYIKNVLVSKKTKLETNVPKQSKGRVTNNILATTSKNSMPLLIDAVFMPINKVNYIIERNYLSEQREQQTNTSSHIVILEIWTNGSIHPRQSIQEALQHLMSLFSGLETIKILNSLSLKQKSLSFDKYRQIYKKIKYDYEYYNDIEKVNKKLELESELFPETILEYEKQYRKQILNEWNSKFDVSEIGNSTLKQKLLEDNEHFVDELVLNKKNKLEKGKQINLETVKSLEKETLDMLNYVDIGNLNLSLRPYTCLRNANINNLADLLQCSAENLLLIKNFGKKSLQEVEKSLEEIGLKLVI